MIHQPLGGAQGQAADIEIQANEILHHKLTLNGYLAEFTGQGMERITQDTGGLLYACCSLFKILDSQSLIACCFGQFVWSVRRSLRHSVQNAEQITVCQEVVMQIGT